MKTREKDKMQNSGIFGISFVTVPLQRSSLYMLLEWKAYWNEKRGPPLTESHNIS